MSKEYEKAYREYSALAQKANDSSIEAKDRNQAFKDKARAFEQVRGAEREAARQGTILAKGQVVKENIPTKRDLQSEYIRKFDDKTPVVIDGKETTLQAFHRRRLTGK